MMNKPMMGQQPTPAAPGQPPSLNFQSDPSMRSQFKGFMSGMAARNMPAPMPQPAMMMPTMPQQMSSVDIFQPVQAFARGGAALDAFGGAGASMSDIMSGRATPAGRDPRTERDFGTNFGTGADFMDDGGVDPVMGALDRALASTAAQNFNDIISQQAALNMADRTARQSGLDAVPNVQTAGDALSRQMAAIEARSPIEQPSIASVSPVSGIAPDTVYDFDTSDVPDLLQNFGTGDPEIAQDIRSQIADVIAKNQNAAMPSAPPSRPTPPRNMGAASPYDMVPVETPIGYDEVGTQVPVQQAPAPESILDRAARKDAVPSDTMMQVTRGRGAGTTPMEQIASRTMTDLFEERAPGMGGIIQGGINALARGVSTSVLDKISKGGQPVLDENNQIVGVVHEGLFGGNVYTGRPGYDPIANRNRGGGQNFRSMDVGSQQFDIGDTQQGQDAASSFLKLLPGFEQGGEVPGFFRGGDVPGDRGGTQGSGGAISGGVRDSGGARSYSADSISFDNNDDGDSGTQTIVATPTSQAETQTIMATPSGGTVSQQPQDVVPATVPEGTFKTNMNVQDLSPRERIAAVEATARPSFGELAMDLLDVGDLLSSYQDAGMNVQPTVPDGSFITNQVAQDALGTSIPASLQSITPQAAGIQQGIQGLQNVSTQRQSSGFSLPSIPSLSEIGQAIMGTRPTYDNLTRAR